MFCKLALGNVRRSFRDYGVYLLTLTFGVCLFYTFNSVEDQGAILYLQEKNGETVRAILTVLGVLSVFVAVVLACLILYAHRFLLRRRKKELGCYLLLGMSPGQVSRLLILETAVTGLISLIAGLVLGSAASSGLSALTLSLFQMDVSAQLGLVFSPGAAVKTAVCFGAILLLVMALSGVEVTRARLIDLLRGDRKNEVLPLRPLSASVIQFVAGVACLLIAYGILLNFGLVTALVILPLCAAMLILGTAGTLLLFRSLPGFVLHGVKKRPALYYRGLNLFTLRQWLSRVRYRFISPGKCGISHIYLIAGVRIGKSDCQRIPRSQTGPGIFKSQIQRKCSALFYFITQCGKFLPGGRNFPAIFLKQIFVI